MLYSYKPTFEISPKRHQESIIANKIFKVLNQDNNNNIFQILNSINYKEFLEMFNLKIVMLHFKDSLDESEFKLIIDNILKFTNANNSSSNEYANVSYQKQLTARSGNSKVYTYSEKEDIKSYE